MKCRQIFWQIGVLLSLALSSQVFAETYTSIAYSVDDEYVAWAMGDTQEEANIAVMTACARLNHTHCKIAFFTAYVVAEGANSTGVAYGPADLNWLETSALKTCEDEDCEVVKIISNPGFFALAETLDSTKSQFVNGGTNLDDLTNEAVKLCKEKYDEECQLVTFGAFKGAVDVTTFNVDSNAQMDQNCRPTKLSIKCSSSCVNGDCLVTYENGCKLRIQVQPEYDTFSNSWIYPAPSC